MLGFVDIDNDFLPPGYDEGGFSAAVGLPSFQAKYGLLSTEWVGNASGLATRTANITSFGVLGAALGCLVAVSLTDRLGRLRSWQLFVLWWATGNLIQIFANGILGLMYFARFWGGIGAGGCTVVVPLYLSEVARPKYRGRIVSVYIVVNLVALCLGKTPAVHAVVEYN
jgi:MFS family permease